MKGKQLQKPISPQKLAANRNNATSSTGPRTTVGKQRASQNSYKHGFYGNRLFPSKELIAQDGADYNRVLASFWNHYSPVGDLEKLCVEKIAVHSLRLARLLGYEQTVLAWRTPFEHRSVDKILRFESNVSRQMEKAIAQLEFLQAEREAESNPIEPSDIGADDAINVGDEASDGRFGAPKKPIFEEPPKDIPSRTAPEAPLTTAQPHVGTNASQGCGEPSNKQAEHAASTPPPPENCVQNPGAQTLATVIEKEMNSTSAQHDMNGRESVRNFETDEIGSDRFVETVADAEMIESTKRGDDLEQLE